MEWKISNSISGTKHYHMQRKNNYPLYVKCCAIAIIILIGISCFYIISCAQPSSGNQIQNSNEGPISRDRKESAERKRRHQKKLSSVKSIGVVKALKSQAENTEKNQERTYLGSKVIKVDVTTNKAGIVVERLFTVDGKTHRVNHYPPPTFKHASDNYLALVLSTPLGAVMPPLPSLSHEKNLEASFMESLKDEIIINHVDDEETKVIKEKVILARESMKLLLKQGRTFADVLEEERGVFNENHDIRSSVIKEYNKIVSGASEEDAEGYRTAINKKLNEMGIEEIPFRLKKQSNQESSK